MRIEQPQNAGAPEIEVTPEMTDAGVDAFYENAIWSWETPSRAELRKMLREVFRAMLFCYHPS